MQNICLYTRNRAKRPLHKGLPTVESHRSSHPLVATHELQSLDISHVIIGDTAINLLIAQQCLI